MKDTIKGIAIGIIIAIALGTSFGGFYFVLRKVSEHDAIFRQHAAGINQIWAEVQLLKEKHLGKKRGRK